MATIATVATQDGQAAVGPATDGTGGEAGAEFTALLSEAAGATPIPPAVPVPVPEARLEEQAPSGPAGPDVPMTAGVVALSIPPELRRAPLGDPPLPRPATSRADPPGHLRVEFPPVLPGTAMQGAAEPAPTAATANGAPAVMLPATVSPVAAAVLSALHPGQRTDSSRAVVPPGGPAPTGAAPIVESFARLVDAFQEGAAADTGTADDGTLAGASGQPASASAVVRDGNVHAAHTRTLAGTVGTPPWREALGAELRLMIERGVGTATLRLSPEHLGPLEVRIDLADDGAKVWFTASHADTRAALAEALPRLRDMLASVGVNLGEAGVQRDLPGEPGRRDGERRGSRADGADAGSDARVIVARLDAGRGMVDEYA